MALTEQDIFNLIDLRAAQMHATQYLSVASWTVLAYDWIISIDVEARFIWQASWSLGRMIYHFNRIWPLIIVCTSIVLFAPTPSPTARQTCKAAVSFYAYGLMIEIATIQSVLLLRVRAVYND
ncbi:hypothetical protein FRC08_005483, partial [Ceratobasidium sp. 394]